MIVFVHKWHYHLGRKSIRINNKNTPLEQIGNYGKVAVCKVKTQKSATLLHISKEQVEFEIGNTVLFTVVPYKMKYLCINLIKYILIQDLCEENYKTLMNEIRKLNK